MWNIKQKIQLNRTHNCHYIQYKYAFRIKKSSICDESFPHFPAEVRFPASTDRNIKCIYRKAIFLNNVLFITFAFLLLQHAIERFKGPLQSPRVHSTNRAGLSFHGEQHSTGAATQPLGQSTLQFKGIHIFNNISSVQSAACHVAEVEYRY